MLVWVVYLIGACTTMAMYVPNTITRSSIMGVRARVPTVLSESCEGLPVALTTIVKPPVGAARCQLDV